MDDELDTVAQTFSAMPSTKGYPLLPASQKVADMLFSHYRSKMPLSLSL